MKIRRVINEAIDQAALKAFTDSLKYYTYTNDVVDTESLIKAVKSEIPANIWNDLFNEYIQLKAKRSYGVIKENITDPVIKKALNAYWVFQFKDNRINMYLGSRYTRYVDDNGNPSSKYYDFHTSTGDKLNAEKIAKQKADAEAKKEAEIKAWEDSEMPKLKAIAEKAISLVDKKAYDEVVTIWTDEFPEKKNASLEPTIKVLRDKKEVQVVFLDDQVLRVSANTDATQLANSIDQRMNTIKTTTLEQKEERETITYVKNNYTKAKWWSPELEDWIAKGRNGTFVFQWPDDEGIQVITQLNWKTIKRCNFSNDVILAGVVTSYSPEMRNRYSATESSYSYTYYSVSNDADEMAIDELGVLLDPSKFVDDSSWGEKHYREIPKQKVENSTDYFKTGMDRWFYLSSESYGSE